MLPQHRVRRGAASEALRVEEADPSKYRGRGMMLCGFDVTRRLVLKSSVVLVLHTSVTVFEGP